jgi:VanZ family protein
MIGTMGMIFYLSHHPGDAFKLPEIWNIDKVLHALAYGFLAVTVIWAFPPRVRKQSPDRIVAGVLCICLIYGISDEVHQSFIPGRFASSLDVVADVVGSMGVVFLWRRMAATRKNKNVHENSI